MLQYDTFTTGEAPLENFTGEKLEEFGLCGVEVVDLKLLKTSNGEEAGDVFEAFEISPVEAKLGEVRTLAEVLEQGLAGKPVFRVEFKPDGADGQTARS